MRLTANIDSWDVEGDGDTWRTMLLAFAKDCRDSADGQRKLADALIANAEFAERMAAEAPHVG